MRSNRSGVFGGTAFHLWRATALVAALLPFALLLSSCSKPAAPEGAQGGPRGRGGAGGAVPVVAATVTTRAAPVELGAFGNVQPYSTVFIKSEVSGLLTEVHFQKGQMVKKGDLLFVIDERSYRAALEQAKANLSRDQVQLENAIRQADRDKELREKGIASQAELEASQTAVAALQQAIVAGQALVDNAQLQLDRCFIRSPLDGKAGNILVDAGNLVKANDVPLVTINQVEPVEVFFSIPGRYLGEVMRYAAGGPLEVRASLPERDAGTETGKLTFIDNAVDKDSGTILLGATFPNKDQRLWPGQYVNVTLTLTVRQDTKVIPSAAVETGSSGKYVFVIKPDQTAEMRPVVAGDEIGKDIIIEEGLNVGEVVVTDGQLRLVPGAKVEITTPEAAPKAAGKGAHQGSGAGAAPWQPAGKPIPQSGSKGAPR